MVIVILGAIVFLIRPDAPATPSQPTTAQQPDFSLTNEEAITRFEELQMTVQQAYAVHDVTLLSSVYALDSPIGTIASRELRQLARDGVYDLTTFDTQSIEVVVNGPRRVELEEVVVVTPHFESEEGEEVTRKGKTVRQTVRWTLSFDDGRWLLFDALVTDATIVR